MLKHAIEALLVTGGVTRLTRARLGGRALVLAYHNIVPEGEASTGDLSLHLPRRPFRAQLEALARTHDVVPQEDAVRAEPGARRPRVAITFDDAYRGAVIAGVAELARLGMPATIFVAPAFVGGGSFWWDALAGDAGLDEAVRGEALDALRGQDAAIRAWAAGRGIAERSLPHHQTVASEDELRAATRVPGIRLASHTWSHPNLARLEGAPLREELERPLVWLRERFPDALPWLTYPYGLSSSSVEAEAAAAGYAGALRVTGGWLNPGEVTDRFAIPRYNVPAGLSPRGLELRAAGLLAR